MLKINKKRGAINKDYTYIVLVSLILMLKNECDFTVNGEMF